MLRQSVGGTHSPSLIRHSLHIRYACTVRPAMETCCMATDCSHVTVHCLRWTQYLVVFVVFVVVIRHAVLCAHVSCWVLLSPRIHSHTCLLPSGLTDVNCTWLSKATQRLHSYACMQLISKSNPFSNPCSWNPPMRSSAVACVPVHMCVAQSLQYRHQLHCCAQCTVCQCDIQKQAR